MSVPPATGRARRGAVAAIALAALVTACGSPQVLAAEDAEARYEAVITDVQGAMGELGYELVHAPATRSVQLHEGACTYTPGNYEVEGLGEDLIHEEGWEPILEAVNPVLDEHGFATRDQPRESGGLLVIGVEDGHGAEFSMTSRGDVRIWGARIEDEACADG